MQHKDETLLARVSAPPRALRSRPAACAGIASFPMSRASRGFEPLTVRGTAAKVRKRNTLGETSHCTTCGGRENAVAPSARWDGKFIAGFIFRFDEDPSDSSLQMAFIYSREETFVVKMMFKLWL